MIVKSWAEQQLGQDFASIEALAAHILSNFPIASDTEAAAIIASATAESTPKGEKILYFSIYKLQGFCVYIEKQCKLKYLKSSMSSVCTGCIYKICHSERNMLYVFILVTTT